MKYDVFISYSRRDYVDAQENVIPGNVVSRIKDALSLAGIKYWFDEDGIYSGENFVEKIVTNIENSEIFLFLSTENSNKSLWTCKEIASAAELRKHIIPMRIDSSPYHRQVLFRIADLDFINYHVNPEKGIADMIASIRKHLEDVKEMERRRMEEEARQREQAKRQAEEKRLQKEREEERRRQEQKQMECELRVACTKLNNEETRLELDREELLQRIAFIEDLTCRDALETAIRMGGAIHQKCQKEYMECVQALQKKQAAEVASLNGTIHKRESEILQLWEMADSETKEYQRNIERLNEQIEELKKKLANAVSSDQALQKKQAAEVASLNETIHKRESEILQLRKMADSKTKEYQRNIERLNEQIEELKKMLESAVSSDSQTSVLGKRTYTVNGVSFTMVAVEGGTFTMGATSEQENPKANERPEHQVRLSSYSIGETEVTQALWKAVMGSNPSYFKGDNLPVENVSWEDCQEFLRRINDCGEHFRLPTEAEWEFAARGGIKRHGYQFSGLDTIDDVAWYKDNGVNRTHPVGMKRANELGLYDMSGNVSEWCQDWYGPYSGDVQENPSGPVSGSHRVVRGGCWYYGAGSCRVAIRTGLVPSWRSSGLGFRLAR